jgi:hypothetical protein
VSEPDAEQLECTQFLRKFDEPDRSVIASASAMEAPNGGLRFSIESTAIVTGPEANPNACVIRVCELLYVAGGVSSGSVRVELKVLGLRMWQDAQSLQDRLIDEAESSVV